MQHSFDSSSYAVTARAAHDMADLLKRVRPELHPQIEELRAIVMRAHDRLNEIGLPQKSVSYLGHSEERSVALDVRDSEVALALNDLEAAFQTLWDMKRVRKTVSVAVSAAPDTEFIETRFTA